MNIYPYYLMDIHISVMDIHVIDIDKCRVIDINKYLCISMNTYKYQQISLCISINKLWIKKNN